MLDDITWVLPGQILYIQFSGTVDRLQIQDMNERCIPLLNSEAKSPPAHLIIDVSRVTHYDHNMMNVKLLQDGLDRHPLVDWVVVVDPYPNAVIRFVSLTLISLMKFRSHVTKNRDEAIAFILPKLPESSGR